MAVVGFTNRDIDWIFDPSNIVRSVDEEVYMVQPSNATLYAIGTHRAKKKKTTNPKYEMIHDVLEARRITLGSGDAYGGGSPTTTYTSADNAQMFQVGAQWRNITKGQNLNVTNVVGTVVTLANADGDDSGNVIAAASGDVFIYSFFPHEEGGLIRNPQMTLVTFPFNAVATVAEPWGITAQSDVTLRYTGKEWARQHKVAIQRHQNELERLFWFSAYKEGAGPTGERLYTPDGMFNIAKTHNTTYTKTDLEDPTKGWGLFMAWFKDHAFNTGSQHRTVCVDDSFNNSLTALTVANTQFHLNEEWNGEYKLPVRRWESNYGIVDFYRAPILNGSLGVAVSFQDEHLFTRWLQPTYLMANIQNPRAMRKEAAIVSTMGPQCAPEEEIAVWRGV